MEAQAPAKIIELMEKFERDQDIYRSSQYNETELRTEFINPFFEALGWDVYHKHECRADKREVKEEDAIDVEGKIKSPDYSFRLFEKRKFFVEVKRPSINIESGVYPAYQIRRYAWSADLAISILTDFEEFSVYYCRARPSKDDKSTKSRLLYFRYDQYAEKWPEIAALFSREAVLNGSLDKYVQSLPQKRGDKRVDAALLDDISEWREMLAKSIARHNPLLDTVSLNFAVQTIIDRIIFLRICEDRGIERYMRLKDLLSGDRVYPRLCELFLQADDRYNSGIFHFGKEPGRDNPDTITPGLSIDDDTLKNIIKRLYFPESPYEFSVLPAEILGQIYEQFLGKVIRLDEGHNALVEDKPEVKKAGGVKYTPAYIVEYIVQSTIAPLLKEKTLQEAAALRVLDPACGSGSFLIVAYQHLLDWHKEWYIQNLVPLIESGRMSEIKKLLPAPAARATSKKGRSREPELPIYLGRGEEWKLTTAERKRILLNNIFGVDIDRQAVEVTKLSLLLKVLEGENEETISKQLKLFAERALPDLSRNIKCGNSLVGWDILKDNPGLSEEEIARINPFDWEREFAEIMRVGGFDVIIGNPPYVRMEGFKELKEYLKNNYASHDERSDLYVYFIERAHEILKIHGLFGMIVSNKFLRANYGKPLRESLIQIAEIKHIIDFAGLPVFVGATVRTIILLTSHCLGSKYPVLYSPPLSVDNFFAVASGLISVEKAISDTTFEVAPTSLLEPYWNFARQDDSALLNRLSEECTPLKVYCNGRICMGVKSGLSEAFVIDEKAKAEILRRNPDAINLIKPLLNGRDVRKYYTDFKGIHLIYTYHGIDINKYPEIEEHLKTFKDRLQKRATRQEWYELQQPQYNFAQFMDGPKIIFPDIAKTPRFALDETGYYSSNTTYFLPLRDLYLLGILNSGIGRFYFVKTCAGLEGKNDTYLRFFGQYLEGFPVHTIDFSDPADVARHDRLVSLVERMLSLHKQLPEAGTPHEKTALERQIEATDGQIDALVYELYGLTEEEIGIVEAARS
ncbi:MAG: Eco57I restriction-modification methylase domain-containing protein [Methanothrix sp.]|nr:Eco57I restriction-modification methylase domain-containing protein [Methanothrix sp.]